MMGLLSALVGGRSAASDAGISVPPMDGVFKPDNRLEEAPRLLSLPGIDNLAPTANGLVCSSGNDLFMITGLAGGFAATKIAGFTAPITLVAAASDGRLALGLEGQGIQIGTPDGGWKSLGLPAEMAACAVAGSFATDATLFVCIGSTQLPASQWKRDLMQHGRSGCLVAIDTAQGTSRPIVGGLAFPFGVAARPDGRLAVSESWRHRVLAIDPQSGGMSDVLLDDLPAYPCRLSRAADGGFWLALFAPRRQLIEFVLREDDYRRTMMATIDPADWIGPELSSASSSPDQPLQAGSVRQMGVLKPWAPSRSYGLVVKCDRNMVPQESWHSRADGTMHGITSVVEYGGFVAVASRGAGTLLRLDPDIAAPDCSAHD